MSHRVAICRAMSKSVAISKAGVGLFRGDQGRGGRAAVHLFGDDFTDRAAAFSALEFAPVMRLHSLRAARTRVHGGADAFAVDTVADANDHANHLHEDANECQSGFCALLHMRNG
ncbi:hypothetical protein, partial [Hyphomonas atlantica]|uniref:hypothetical protein n=1 Tax=Hyphomonas atlantica TaxID=1280948 RepID=UPI003D6D25EE